MKKAILLRLFLIAVLTALVCSAASVFMEQQSYESDLSGSMYATLDGIGKTADFSGDQNQLAKRLSALYHIERITIIRSDGKVMGDSVADYRTMENHLTRPEVAAAVASGRGDSIRRSVTIGQSMLYVALRTDSGTILRAAVPMRDVYSRILHLLPVTLLVLLLALLIAVPVAGRFTRSLLRPVREVVGGISHMRHGDYSLALPDDRYDELSPLIVGVNELAATIRDTISQLQAERDKLSFIFNRVTQGIVIVENDTRVAQINRAARLFLSGAETKQGETLFDYTRSTAIIRATESCLKDGASNVFDVEDEKNGRIYGVSVSPVDGEWIQNGAMILVADRTEERRSQQLRREFVANASHELKTPVTSIRGFAELISSGLVTDQEQITNYIARIQAEADRMSALISDILALSALEEGTGRPQAERVDVFAAARAVTESLAPQAASSHVELSLSGGGAMVFAAPEYVRTLLVNLVENAIKYNRPGGRVDVSIAKRRGMCEITVADTGIGIPPKSIPRIFERFYRVDQGRDRRTGGTGLGLAIVKHIVSQLGGTIAVTSTQGIGTEFIVNLPIS